jgi:hypothetical protein
MSRFALPLALAWFATALLPEAAAACAACYGGAEESRKAFLFTTLLLSLLPVSMFGALGWWVWRRARETDASDGSAPTAEPATAAGARVRPIA